MSHPDIVERFTVALMLVAIGIRNLIELSGSEFDFSEGIVFVVGGAGYVEYGNLEEWAQRTGKRVTYGGTEIVDPRGFLRILESLGKSAA